MTIAQVAPYTRALENLAKGYLERSSTARFEHVELNLSRLGERHSRTIPQMRVSFRGAFKRLNLGQAARAYEIDLAEYEMRERNKKKADAAATSVDRRASKREVLEGIADEETVGMDPGEAAQSVGLSGRLGED